MKHIVPAGQRSVDSQETDAICYKAVMAVTVIMIIIMEFEN